MGIVPEKAGMTPFEKFNQELRKRWHGLACKLCIHFDTCGKKPLPDQGYCMFTENRFKSKIRRIQ